VTTSINVDDVAVDRDLEKYTAGRSGLQDLLPEDSTWYESGGGAKSALPARQTALENVLKSLKNRRPPIYEYQLLDVTELKQAVVFGALEILYRGAVQHEDSPNAKKAKDFGDKYRAEVTSLQPQTNLGVASSGIAARIFRG